MKIGDRPVEAPTSTSESTAGDWCVRVSLSVLDQVPNDVLRPWLALEGFCRNQPSCWPSNKALAVRMGIKLRAAQYAIETLEDHGILVRRRMPGNRRVFVMVRRSWNELSSVEWATMVDAATRRAAGRAALATARKIERKRYKPPVKIVG